LLTLAGCPDLLQPSNNERTIVNVQIDARIDLNY
jgi:hypothetical protein